MLDKYDEKRAHSDKVLGSMIKTYKLLLVEENPLLLTKSINCKTIGPKVETFARYHNGNV